MVLDPGKDHYLIINKDIVNESIELIIDPIHNRSINKSVNNR